MEPEGVGMRKTVSMMMRLYLLSHREEVEEENQLMTTKRKILRIIADLRSEEDLTLMMRKVR